MFLTFLYSCFVLGLRLSYEADCLVGIWIVVLLWLSQRWRVLLRKVFLNDVTSSNVTEESEKKSEKSKWSRLLYPFRLTYYQTVDFGVKAVPMESISDSEGSSFQSSETATGTTELTSS